MLWTSVSKTLTDLIRGHDICEGQLYPDDFLFSYTKQPPPPPPPTLNSKNIQFCSFTILTYTFWPILALKQAKHALETGLKIWRRLIWNYIRMEPNGVLYILAVRDFLHLRSPHWCVYITKTCLFEYTVNFTTKNWIFSDKKFWFLSYFCSKHRLWILVRTASTRRF